MSTELAEDAIQTKEFDHYLTVTERTTYGLAAAEKTPAFEVGGMWRFSRIDIGTWIKQQSMNGLDATCNSNVAE